MKVKLLFISICSLLIITSCATKNEDMNTEKYNNPLEACPDTPNCIRLSYEVEEDFSTALEAFEITLRRMKAHEITMNDDGFHAVFRIPLFGYLDDVNIQLEGIKSGKTIVHMRSASRIGYSDLGVNRMRVKKMRSEYVRSLK